MYVLIAYLKLFHKKIFFHYTGYTLVNDDENLPGKILYSKKFTDTLSKNKILSYFLFTQARSSENLSLLLSLAKDNVI